MLNEARDSGPDEPKSILFAANTDWYLYNFRLSLIEAAKARGLAVELVCPPGHYADRLEQLGFEVRHAELSSNGYSLIHEFKAFYQFWRVLSESRADVVHLFTIKCVLYGLVIEAFRRRRSRAIAAITGLGHAFTSDSLRNRIVRNVISCILRVAARKSNTHFIFQNEADREQFVQLEIVERHNTDVIRGSGFDENRFYPISAEASSRSETKSLRFLFCGRLIAEKGIREYLAATEMAQAEGFVFESMIAGDVYPGNPTSLTASEIQQLKDETEHQFLGHHSDMPSLFSSCDVVVLPSYREGTPKALIEAAASGCIIIATDIPGCAGIVENDVNGYLVPTKNAHALFCAMQRVFDADEATRRAMKDASRTIALSEFSDTTVIENTLLTYRNRGLIT